MDEEAAAIVAVVCWWSMELDDAPGCMVGEQEDEEAFGLLLALVEDTVAPILGSR